MATSISNAHAEALAESFLDQIGSDRTGEGIRLKKTTSELILLAGTLVSEAQNNLNKADRVATGALSESLKILNPSKVDGGIRVDVEALYYYKFIDAGVKGTKKGSSRDGYKYSNKMPPVNVIRKWLIREGLKGKTIRNEKLKPKTDKLISSREKFRKSITETSNRVAFAIARSIYYGGLKRTNFFAKALTTTERKADSVFGSAFEIDVINSLPNKL